MKWIATIAGAVTVAAYVWIGDWTVAATVVLVVLSLHFWRPRWRLSGGEALPAGSSLDGVLMYLIVAWIPTMLWLLRD